MKRIVLIFTILLGIGLTSCDITTRNEGNCATRADVQLMDGGGMWVYNLKVYDGYAKGNDEMGQSVYLPMHQVFSITIVDCED